MVTDTGDLRQNMGTQYNRMLLSKPADQFPNLDDLLGIQADHGFIQNQNLRIPKQSLGQSHSLLIAFGQMADQAVLHVLDAAFAHDALHLAAPVIFRHLFQLCSKAQIFQHSHIRIERRNLRQVADAFPGFHGLFSYVVAVDQDLALSRSQIAGHHVHSGGFSGAVGA